ncbi:MAG: hypothetical protein BGN87_06195 [Rhizobiales bacterium 65-79]|jgi:cell wall-associated NlpC family hydrolase|nr:C40 family peptidase [Hyphomicrobiales bacterium]OJU02783.1 MAG: hypothetical protein BGN87_06195 [Rhizobiales bacterium 65-79]
MRGYVGVPFRDGGRDQAGWDCWGLVRFAHWDEAGVELPSYGEISAADLLSAARAMREGAQDEIWRRVTDLPRRRMDVVLMRRLGDSGRAPVHVGILADERRMLHVEEAADTHLVPLDHPTVRPRILDFFRHRDLP